MGWHQVMVDKMFHLDFNGTWELVPFPYCKFVVGCKWIYTTKVDPNGNKDHLKFCLVANGYIQISYLNYGNTFSPMAKMAYVHLFLSMATIYH